MYRVALFQCDRIWADSGSNGSPCRSVMTIIDEQECGSTVAELSWSIRFYRLLAYP